MAKKIQELDKNLAAKPAQSDGFEWLSAHDPRLSVRGLAWWNENGNRFCRLPMRAAGVVREPVWELGQCPASARVVFRSDTQKLAVRVVNSDVSVMSHMPGTGSNGLALYCGEPHRQRYWGTAIPSQTENRFTAQLFDGAAPQMREFTLYLPLYKALLELEVGIDEGAAILRATSPVLPKPVVFYGTSITQGGCANTAGSDYVSTIGRLLNVDVINLGFSGNGRGEREVAEFVGEIDAALFVLDYAGNVEAPEMKSTLPGFVQILRRRHPNTPIAIVSHVTYAQSAYSEVWRRRIEDGRDTILEYYVSQRKAGDRNFHFIDGGSLVPFGTNAAFVDGIHPTDHGFQMMAERMAPQIESIILRDPPVL